MTDHAQRVLRDAIEAARSRLDAGCEGCLVDVRKILCDALAYTRDEARRAGEEKER